MTSRRSCLGRSSESRRLGWWQLSLAADFWGLVSVFVFYLRAVENEKGETKASPSTYVRSEIAGQPQLQPGGAFRPTPFHDVRSAQPRFDAPVKRSDVGRRAIEHDPGKRDWFAGSCSWRSLSFVVAGSRIRNARPPACRAGRRRSAPRSSRDGRMRRPVRRIRSAAAGP